MWTWAQWWHIKKYHPPPKKKEVPSQRFMYNMLYACSILYKTKLPFIVVMDKTDNTDHSSAVE